MKKWISYLLLLSNVVLFIGIAISMYMFFQYKKNYDGDGDEVKFLNQIQLGVIPPTVSVVLSSIILITYQIFTNRQLHDRIFFINPKLLKSIKISSYATVINMIVPFIILMIALTITSSISIYERIILVSVSLAISGFFGLLIIGAVSYINLRIAFDDIKRVQSLENEDFLLEKKIEEFKQPANETFEHEGKFYYHDGNGNYFVANEKNEWVPTKKSVLNSKDNSTSENEKATSGSF